VTDINLFLHTSLVHLLTQTVKEVLNISTSCGFISILALPFQNSSSTMMSHILQLLCLEMSHRLLFMKYSYLLLL